MSIKDRLIEKLEEPSRINISAFCEEYINLSEKYWSLADDVIIKGIDEAQEEILKNRQIGKDCGMFNNLSLSQILGTFHKRRIAIYSSIAESSATYIQNSIDRYLRKNEFYASKLDLFIPKTTEHLSTYQYYYNYVLVKKRYQAVKLPVINKLGK